MDIPREELSDPPEEPSEDSAKGNGETRNGESKVDEESQESFPASDSPSW